jgi:hypothetical protein
MFLYFPETKFKTTQYYQAHILRYHNISFSVLYVVFHKAIFIFSEGKLSHTSGISPLIKL